jgi:hypothetical protein
LVTLGLAIPNLYSKEGSFWDWFRKEKPTAPAIKQSEPTIKQIEPIQIPWISGIKLPIPQARIVIPEGVKPQITIPVVFSPSVDPTFRKTAIDWLTKDDENKSTFRYLDTADLNKVLSELESDGKAVLIGTFDLKDATLLKGKISGLPNTLATTPKQGSPPFLTTINIKGEVHLKNDTRLENMIINTEAPLILEDNSQIENVLINIKYSPVVLRGKAHSPEIALSVIDCTKIIVGDITKPTIGIKVESGTGDVLDNKKIYNCSIAIKVEAGAKIVAQGNEIFNSLIGVWFDDGCVDDNGNPIDPCKSMKPEIGPPTGKFTHNILYKNVVGAYVLAGSPDLRHNTYYWPTYPNISGPDHKVSVLNLSGWTMLPPPNVPGEVGQLNAQSQNYPLPLELDSRLKITYDDLCKTYLDKPAPCDFWGIFQSKDFAAKNVVNLGRVKNGEIGWPVTWGGVGCSLVPQQ